MPCANWKLEQLPFIKNMYIALKHMLLNVLFIVLLIKTKSNFFYVIKIFDDHRMKILTQNQMMANVICTKRNLFPITLI